MLLVDWNNTQRDYPRDATLHALFEAQARLTPSRVALMFEGATMTFAELNERANRLAHRLRALGITRDRPVGVCLERSLDLPAALLAVLKAGGAYVPLDPAYPGQRLAYMMADARTHVIISHSKHRYRLGTLDPQIRAIWLDLEKLDTDSAANPHSHTQPQDLAYVIYTSGSTGQPKGAGISHAAICNHMLWMQEEFPLGESGRVLQKTPISFDASVWEFWAPLLAGARLVLAAPDAQRDNRQLFDAVLEHGITTLQLVPSMLRVMAAEPGFAKCTTLTRLFAGGERLTPDLRDKVHAALPDCELINLYGPTECAIDATFHRCRRGDTRVPIGRPVANTRLYI